MVKEDAPLSIQCRRILERLRQGPMNNIEGWVEVGIYRVSARIHDLRNAGYDIETKRITVTNRYGEPCHGVAQYILVE